LAKGLTAEGKLKNKVKWKGVMTGEDGANWAGGHLKVRKVIKSGRAKNESQEIKREKNKVISKRALILTNTKRAEEGVS